MNLNFSNILEFVAHSALLGEWRAFYDRAIEQERVAVGIETGMDHGYLVVRLDGVTFNGNGLGGQSQSVPLYVNAA